MGTFIVLYASGYMKGHSYLGRFYLALLLFMASMLGVVLSDNLITLFIFWELTSFTSFMLIGFNHESTESRKSALQARSEEHTSELQSRGHLVCRLLLEKKQHRHKDQN